MVERISTCSDGVFWEYRQAPDEDSRNLRENRIYTSKGLKAIRDAAKFAGIKLSRSKGNNYIKIFRLTHGNLKIKVGKGLGPKVGNCETTGGEISCHEVPDLPNTLHEFGHAFDNAFGLAPSNQIPIGKRSTDGLQCGVNGTTSCLENTGTYGEDDRTEELADFYLNWVLDDVPGYDDYGLTDEFTVMYGNQTREEWWDSNILPLIP